MAARDAMWSSTVHASCRRRHLPHLRDIPFFFTAFWHPIRWHWRQTVVRCSCRQSFASAYFPVCERENYVSSIVRLRHRLIIAEQLWHWQWRHQWTSVRMSCSLYAASPQQPTWSNLWEYNFIDSFSYLRRNCHIFLHASTSSSCSRTHKTSPSSTHHISLLHHTIYSSILSSSMSFFIHNELRVSHCCEFIIVLHPVRVCASCGVSLFGRKICTHTFHSADLVRRQTFLNKFRIIFNTSPFLSLVSRHFRAAASASPHSVVELFSIISHRQRTHTHTSAPPFIPFIVDKYASARQLNAEKHCNWLLVFCLRFEIDDRAQDVSTQICIWFSFS